MDNKIRNETKKQIIKAKNLFKKLPETKKQRAIGYIEGLSATCLKNNNDKEVSHWILT